MKLEGTYKIGSVKPNIGHCEGASGISQLIKVILSLKHKTLVPTLPVEDLNPNINFGQLPFQLQEEVSEWKPVMIDGYEAPRRAGITGIGAGGVNAHIIVEEYIIEPETPNKLMYKLEPIVFILSTKSKERLKDYVRNWIIYLKKNQSFDLENIAYTLQVGREEMSCRLAIVADNRTNLIYQLEQWIRHQENTDCCYFGDLNISRIIVQEAVAQVLKNGVLNELAKLWVLGNSIPWKDLYHGKKILKITQLPTYPFERRKCWMGDNQTCNTNTSNGNNLMELLGINNYAYPITDVILTGKTQKEDYTELEKSIAEVWGRELGLKEININSNFFEMGGNSLIAIKLEVELSNIGILINHSDINCYPSIAELASFVSQETNIGINSIKILDNIEPFNDIYYKDCFYSALFPVVKHFNKDITPFLVNDVDVYTCQQDNKAKLITINYKSSKTVEQLLKNQDIICKNKIKSDNIINDITESIAQNRPIIVAIDCFYVPMREDLYQKVHWEHFWLVYGYDNTQQIFNIVEHRHRGSLTYKKYIISYQDLVNSYVGYLSNFQMGNEAPTYFEFYLENTINSLKINHDDEVKKIYAANIVNNKHDILEGLKEIKIFEEYFKKTTASGNINKNINKIIEMLNHIINTCKAEMYKIKLLYPEKEDIVVSLNKVIDSWEFIRLKLSRCMFTSLYDNNSINATLEKLANIYEYELEYQSLHISFLEGAFND